MLFNSLEFFLFLPVVFFLYWFIFNRNLRWQNALLLVASYFFYGWWDWRFLSLILFSSLVDYGVGQGMMMVDRRIYRRLLLMGSIGVNIGFLGFFKYFNFFADTFCEAFRFMGSTPSLHTLNIILPVGISFYTFQTLSYSIDVYRGHLKPSKDIVSFLSFVSFFPQLVAGPIERATHLLPQFYSHRSFTYSKAVDGMRQILWGLFKKVVVADTCAPIVNTIFSESAGLDGSTLLWGALLFAFQIYGDFSGYSDMAIGVARLFGFDLMQNFAFPYFSRDMAEFWRRWHISLSTWFRDYIYIPLGGSRGGRLRVLRNTFVIFITSGFWHGANWTFIMWGVLNALYFIPLLLTKKNRRYTEIVAIDSHLPSIVEILSMGKTFLLTVLAWVFFRAATVGDAWDYLGRIFSPSLFTNPKYVHLHEVLVLLIMLMMEWWSRRGLHGLCRVGQIKSQKIRWTIYLAVVWIIFIYGNFNQTEFIYFAF